MPDLIHLNLRGQTFIAASDKMKEFIQSLTEKNLAFLRQNGEYFINRNPIIFQSVLDYYSGDGFHLPKHVCPVLARKEVTFWMIPADDIPICCYKTLYDDNLDDYKTLNRMNDNTAPSVASSGQSPANVFSKVRNKMLHAQHHPTDSLIGKIWKFTTVLFYVLSIVAYLLDSSMVFRDSRKDLHTLLPQNMSLANITSNPNLIKFISTKMSIESIVLEIVSNMFILFDVVVKFIITHKKLAFISNITNISDVIVVMSIFLILHIENHPVEFMTIGGKALMSIVKMLYSLRAVRILQLANLSPGMNILRLTFMKSWKELLLLVLIFLSFSLIFGSIMYWTEFHTSETFPNICISVWWAIVTMTTVGYGDKYPSSLPGYFVGSVAAFSGLLILTMPIALISSNFSTLVNCYRYVKLHQKMSKDGNITAVCDTKSRVKP